MDEITKIEVLKRMDRLGFAKLVEKLSTKFCKAFAPTRRFGLDKAAVRGIVVQTLIQIAEGEPEPYIVYVPPGGRVVGGQIYGKQD